MRGNEGDGDGGWWVVGWWVVGWWGGMVGGGLVGWLVGPGGEPNYILTSKEHLIIIFNCLDYL